MAEDRADDDDTFPSDRHSKALAREAPRRRFALVNQSRNLHQPEAPVLKLRFSFVAPKGQPHYSPGHRPGYRSVAPKVLALKGRNRLAGLQLSASIKSFESGAFSDSCATDQVLRYAPVRPLQGKGFLIGRRFPGRCPGLICRCPFGAKSPKAQLQKNQRGSHRPSTAPSRTSRNDPRSNQTCPDRARSSSTSTTCLRSSWTRN